MEAILARHDHLLRTRFEFARNEKRTSIFPNNGKEIIFEAQRQHKLFWIGFHLIIDIFSFAELPLSYDLPWFCREPYLSIFIVHSLQNFPSNFFKKTQLGNIRKGANRHGYVTVFPENKAQPLTLQTQQLWENFSQNCSVRKRRVFCFIKIYEQRASGWNPAHLPLGSRVLWHSMPSTWEEKFPF